MSVSLFLSVSLYLSLGGYEFQKEQGGYMWEGLEGGKGREKIIIIRSQNNLIFKKDENYHH